MNILKKIRNKENEQTKRIAMFFTLYWNNLTILFRAD